MPTAAERIVETWRTTATSELQAQERSLRGLPVAKRRGRMLHRLAKDDVDDFLPESGITPTHVEALGIHLGSAVTVKTLREVNKVSRAPKLPSPLSKAAYHRVMATRSVAADRLGEADPLTAELGFRTTVEKTAAGLTSALIGQKQVILQKDSNGKDLPDAAAKRARLAAVGLTANYVKAKIDPQLAILQPFFRSVVEVDHTPAALWQWTLVVASRDFLSAAELSFDDPGHVKKYRNAQPRSQAGRFAKKKQKPVEPVADGTEKKDVA